VLELLIVIITTYIWTQHIFCIYISPQKKLLWVSAQTCWYCISLRKGTSHLCGHSGSDLHIRCLLVAACVFLLKTLCTWSHRCWQLLGKRLHSLGNSLCLLRCVWRRRLLAAPSFYRDVCATLQRLLPRQHLSSCWVLWASQHLLLRKITTALKSALVDLSVSFKKF
jgi:hypothetical protein